MVTRIFHGNVMGDVKRQCDLEPEFETWGDSPAPVRKLSPEEVAAYQAELEARKAKGGR